MTAKHLFTPAQRAHIVWAYNAGHSARDLSTHYGLGRRLILRVLREERVPLRKGGGSDPMPERNRQIIELANKGYSFSQIAQHVGVSRQRANYIVQRGY